MKTEAKKKLYLVTGGMGFLGSALVQRLVKEGHRVRVLDNLSRGAMRRLGDAGRKVDFVRGDIRDARAVQKAARGADGVWHLAFINGTEYFYTKPDLVLDVGVRGMVNVIDACLKHKIGELILASSAEVYQTPPRVPTDEKVALTIPDPLNPRFSYGAGKIISEIMAVNFGRKYFDRVLIFRPHNVYGPDMGWEHVIPQFAVRMKKLCSKNKGQIRFPIQGTGKETRAFIFINDLIDGLMVMAKKGEHLGIYHIGTEEEVPIAKVAELVARYFGRRIRLIRKGEAKGGTPRRCPDTSRIRRLGFRPNHSLEEGIKITCQWYDGNAHKAPA